MQTHVHIKYSSTRTHARTQVDPKELLTWNNEIKEILWANNEQEVESVRSDLSLSRGSTTKVLAVKRSRAKNEKRTIRGKGQSVPDFVVDRLLGVGTELSSFDVASSWIQRGRKRGTRAVVQPFCGKLNLQTYRSTGCRVSIWWRESETFVWNWRWFWASN